MNRVTRSSKGRGLAINNGFGNKRKAEVSPSKKIEVKKRSALGDLTNAKKATDKEVKGGKKVSVPAKKKVVPKVSLKAAQTQKEDSLLYTTAIQTPEPSHSVKELNRKNIEQTEEKKRVFPDGVSDFDEECGADPFQVGIYAQDIFDYYKRRELRFPVKMYLANQDELNRNMRSILIDWMVEVQENFELNHETLYMAVKLVDLFLGKVFVKRDKLQLVGTTALYLASKFDERSPPIIDDFCYICDDAYPQEDVIRMEMKLLKALNFDIGFPLSYRFLRRFARCGKIEMERLTFARYILEICLTEYELIDTRDSMMAAAALYLAMKIKAASPDEVVWTPTLEFYSGYKSEDLFDLTHRVFNVVRNVPPHLKTIKTKYSHTIFFEVSKIPIPEELHL